MKLPKDFREFIESLNSESVRYVIVGGYAVAHHGYPRYTGDIDFFVEPSAENARRIVKVLQRFGFAGLGLTERDFAEGDRVIQLGVPPRRIDIVTGISGVSFAEAWSTKGAATLDGLPVFFVSREVLLKNKAAADRPQDRVDHEEMTRGDLDSGG